MRAYLERTQRIGQLEEELRRLVAEEVPTASWEHDSVPTGRASGQALTESIRHAVPSTDFEHRAAIEDARRELTALRRQQAADRPLVEAVLQLQVREELVEAGLGLRGFVWPPVQFTFIEPPLKLTVSPAIGSVPSTLVYCKLSTTR